MVDMADANFAPQTGSPPFLIDRTFHLRGNIMFSAQFIQGGIAFIAFTIGRSDDWSVISFESSLQLFDWLLLPTVVTTSVFLNHNHIIRCQRIKYKGVTKNSHAENN